MGCRYTGMGSAAPLHRYAALATFSRGGWDVDVPDLPGVVVHAPDRDSASAVIGEAIARVFETDPSTFAVDVTFAHLPPALRPRRSLDEWLRSVGESW